MLQDLRYAVRALGRTPAFTGLAAVTLALGIGANAAMFSVINTVLLRPLPFRDPGRLVRFEERRGDYRLNISYPNYLDWRERSRTFEEMAVFNPTGRAVIRGGARAEVVASASAEARLFRVLGIDPLHGRLFSEEEHRPGAERVVLLTYRLWQRRYGGDTSVVGRPIDVGGGPATVVGILPPSFRLLNAEVWYPLGPYLSSMQFDRGNHPGFQVYARLRDSVSIEQAQGEMSAIAADLARQYPATNHEMGVFLVPMVEYVLGSARGVLVPLGGAVAFVLLIACANVSNVLLARGLRRERETAVRSALGAGRWKLIRLFLAESWAIAALGGGLGLLLGSWGVRAARALPGFSLYRASEVAVDGRVLAYTMALSFATVLAFGLAPALQLSRVDLMSSLRLGGASAAGMRGRRLRELLIALEVALSLVLVVGAALMIRTIARLADVDHGYRPDGLVAVHLHQQWTSNAGDAAASFIDRVLPEIAAAPGVAGAAAAWPLDVAGGPQWAPWVNFPHRRYPEGQEPTVLLAAVTPSYFDVMGIPLRRGRLLGPEDKPGAPVAIVVNETFARRHFADRDPIGGRVSARGIPALSDMRIVGIVGDTRRAGPSRGVAGEAYCAYAQFPTAGPTIVVRAAAGDPLPLARIVEDRVAAIDRDVTTFGARRVADAVADTVGNRRLVSILLALFAAVALALTAIGIAGVVAYVVAQRTQEIGVRMALGADARAVVRLVLRGAMGPVVAGLTAGAVAMVPLTRVIESFLFGVKPADPIALAAGAAALVAAAITAAYIPARRATRIDPLVSLRS